MEREGDMRAGHVRVRCCEGYTQIRASHSIDAGDKARPTQHDRAMLVRALGRPRQ